MRTSLSWRVTHPLRFVDPAYLRRPLNMARGVRASFRRDLAAAFACRVAQAVETLRPGAGVRSRLDVHEALGAFEEALTSSTAPVRAKAWLSLVAVDASYPDDRSVERMARVLRMEGPSGLCEELRRRFARNVRQGRATAALLDVRRDRVIVDVTHTVTSDFHTGIQRVVSKTVTQWIEGGRPMDLIRFDLRPPTPRLLSHEEFERLNNWRAMVDPAAPPTDRARLKATAKTLVPWGCRLVIAELPFEPARTAAYRGLATASVLRSLSVVGFDLIPIVASGNFIPKVTAEFGAYLSIVKHADRVSAISRTSRDSFMAFATMAAAEGLLGPTVEAHELPAEAPTLDPATVEAARTTLGIGAGPMILVVGSHEPRKNHLAVLEAAERLWAHSDRAFALVFLGWSGWLSEEFDELAGKLVSAGRPIVVRKRSSEVELWAAYRLARFTVFPSLIEGFGLPIAESLASGTPVITSNYGSCAEVAEKGGCLLVDPRSVDELERAMALLLDDDEALGKLCDEASAVDTGTWDRYARQVWDFFVESADDDRSTAYVQSSDSRDHRE